jgi:hypothetical protein
MATDVTTDTARRSDRLEINKYDFHTESKAILQGPQG